MRQVFAPLLSLLLASAPVLAGGGTSVALTAPQPSRALWTAQVDQGSGIESAGYFGVFAVQRGHAVALEHRTGRLQWRGAAPDLAATPLQRQPMVFFSTQGGAVTALDFFTGKERWRVGGGDGPVRLAYGPATSAQTAAVLAFGRQIVLALDRQTGALLWRVDAVSPRHTVEPVRSFSGPTLILHSPSEGFLGRVYTAHEATTGRELWRLRVGEGLLLGQDTRGLVFDLRDWPAELGAGGSVPVALVNPETGALTRGRLKVAVPDATAWRLEPGTLILDGAGGTWALAVRVRDGTVSLIHTPVVGQVSRWTIRGRISQLGSGASLRLDGEGVLVGLPDGSVTLLKLRSGALSAVLPPGGGPPVISERLGGALAVSRPDQTVFLDDDGSIRLRVPGRADEWAAVGDLATVMVQRGSLLEAYAWPTAPTPSGR